MRVAFLSFLFHGASFSLRSPRSPLRTARVTFGLLVAMAASVQAAAAEVAAAPVAVKVPVTFAAATAAPQSNKSNADKGPVAKTIAASQPLPSMPAPAAPLGAQIEDLKKASLELNRDLSILEEDLLFPASTQIAVFLSLDVGQYFNLDSVKLTIDDQLVASHLYTPKQSHALIRGGIQRLYLGNLKTGKHEITAFFIGKGPDERDYKRGATYNFTKDQKPGMLEIRIMDATRNMQPTFEFKEWHL